MISFAAWMNQLDIIVINATGMSVYDLADMPFRDAYDSEDSPEEFAEQYMGINEDGTIDWDLLRDLS